MNALSAQVQEEIRAAAQEAGARADVRVVVVYGGPKVFAAGADVKEMAGWTYQQMVDRSVGAAVVVHRRGAHPQADHRRDHRLRARRRLRARAVLRPAHRRRQRQARPARDPARHHPGRRRHAAAHAPRRSVAGQGAHLHRPVRRRRGGAARSVSSTASSRPTTSTPRRSRSPSGSPRARRTRCARPRRPSTAGSRSTSRPGWRSSGCSSRRCSPPRTARSAWRRSSSTARARPSSTAADRGRIRLSSVGAAFVCSALSTFGSCASSQRTRYSLVTKCTSGYVDVRVGDEARQRVLVGAARPRR